MDANQPAPSSRREFGKACVLLAATPLVGTAAAQAQADPNAATTEALFAIVRQRYGKFMTPAQLDLVKRQVARNQFLAQTIKEIKLGNGDEPAFAARADLP